MDGLIEWLVSNKKTNQNSVSIIPYIPDYNTYTTNVDNVTYYIYYDGRVQLAHGEKVTTGGIRGLEAWLKAKYPKTTTVTTTKKEIDY